MVETEGRDMKKLLDKLKRDHVNLRRLLDLLSKELDDFFAGDETDFDLKIELLNYIEQYQEQVHHPSEMLIYDVAFPKLKDSESLHTRLQREHIELESMACRFRNTLEGVVQGEVISRDEVETRGREFIALLRQHANLEDQEVFPLVEDLLSEQEWEKIEEKAPKEEDPVFTRQDKVRFSSLIGYLKSHGME
jgi:hemerythrin-like domain-containing protein